MKQMLVLSLCMLLLSLCSGCGTDSKSTSTESITVSESETAVPGTFDIENARKNIIIKGRKFEIPKKLSELDKNWTYECKETYFDEGEGLATLYYQGKEMFTAGLENYYEGKEKDSIIYNLTIKTEDHSSIDGIMPFQTSQSEIIEKYGSPNYEYDTEKIYDHVFKYGISEEAPQPGRMKSQCVSIAFDENDIVISVSITYADLQNPDFSQE